MGARRGSDYLAQLNASPRTVQVHGGVLTGDVAEHPAFRGITRSYAELFDLQHAPGTAAALTFPSPTSGDPVATSHLQPRTVEDLERRRAAMTTWSNHSLGMLGRTGDYLNSGLMAMAAAADWFGAADPRFAANIRAYHEHVREHDLLLTHTLVNPQVNRSVGPSEQPDAHIAAAIVKRGDSGLTIRGARMLATIGPIADEIMVFPSTVLQARPEDEPYAYAFAIPCDTPGLRFLCRESLDYGRSAFDHPLGSRFDEMDAIVIFDDVLVPYERCFMIGRPELLHRGRLYNETSALAHMTHQVVVKDLAKTEALLGIVSLLTEAIQIEGFDHVKEKVAELIVAAETLRSALRAAEVDASASRWGLIDPAWPPLNAARNWFPRTYPRLRQIVWQLGAAGLFGLPTEADVEGAARADVERYLQGADIGGPERVRLFRLAWDASLSAFAGRQEAYEFFFFGDPVRMAGPFVATYDREPYKQRIREFLER